MWFVFACFAPFAFMSWLPSSRSPFLHALAVMLLARVRVAA
jgi:hypothetical protein